MPSPIQSTKTQAVVPPETITLGTDFKSQYGYCPIDVTYNSVARTTTEQEITIRFGFGGRWQPRGDNTIEAEKTFFVPSGVRTGRTTLLIPRYSDWSSMNWEVWIDGRYRRNLSSTPNTLPFNYASRNNNEAPCLLFVSDTRGRAQKSVRRLSNQWRQSNVTVRSLAELSSQWLDYTGYGAIALSADDFLSLKLNHQESFAAVLAWVRAGGNLWIVDVEEGWAGWDFASFTNMSLSAEATKTEKTPADYGWRRVRTGGREKTKEDELQGLIELSEAPRRFALPKLDSLKEKMREFVDPRSGERRLSPRGVDRENNLKILARSFGLGAVAAFTPGKSDPPYNMPIWGTLLGPRMDWSARHGIHPALPNHDFNNFLIPGVGLAPVTEFQVLITLFVLCIGPLNYWLLRRAKRLPWLLATTPIAAALVTLFLFVYGLISDGTDVRVRARSVTQLDQLAGEAASWARLSYYAGIAPRGGLVLPADTAIYPVLPFAQASRSRYTQRSLGRRELVWDLDDKGNGTQRLTEGWLASRTPTQYLGITSRSTQQRLDFKEGTTGLSVSNQLGVRILYLAVEDPQGQTYWCENLADGKSLVMDKLPTKDISTKLRKLISDAEPFFPPGGEIDYRFMNDSVGHFSESLLEAEIAAIVSPLLNGFGRGRYIAITEQGMIVELGASDAREESSFHVVKGRYAKADPPEDAVEETARNTDSETPAEEDEP
ncbi:hypothetical protein [Adhaeretor mobilis]|nr:hypothetical protein [Adhaeretor mobilis]